VQGSDGFYFMHLLGEEASRPLTLEEAKPKIVEAIKRSRVREMVANKGALVARELRETLASGAPLSFALEKAGVKAEKVEPFTLAEDIDPDPVAAANKPKDRGPDFVAVKNAVATLQPGQVSEFFPWEDGGIIALLEKREAPDQSQFAQKRASLEERMLTNKRDMVFLEWMRDRQRDAGILTEKARG
jgi:hypothetical protein